MVAVSSIVCVVLKTTGGRCNSSSQRILSPDLHMGPYCTWFAQALVTLYDYQGLDVQIVEQAMGTAKDIED